REAVGRRGAGGDDVGVLGRETAVEDDVHAELARLGEESAIERLLLGAAADEPAVRLSAADRPRVVARVVERRPVGGAEIEVAGDADAVEERRHGLALRRRLDDLQVADEARADVAFGLVPLDGAARAREHDRGGETGWSRACNAYGGRVLHQKHAILSRRVRR